MSSSTTDLSPAQAPAPSVPAALQRLVSLRWVSILLMLGTTLLVAPAFGIHAPTASILIVTGSLAAWNLITLKLAAMHADGGPWPLFIDLVVDLMAWGCFLYLAGGATNPMISLLLPVIAVGATLLPTQLAWALAAISVGVYSWLWTHHIPLGMANEAQAISWHLGGMWATFAVSALVIAWYITRMNRAMRARDRALATAREQRLRNERVVAMANLAAGAAHELGTPLGTMRLLVDELRRELHGPEQQEDLQLMANQIEQCKEILSRLTAAAGRARADGPAVRPVGAWLDALLATLLEQRPGLTLLRTDADPTVPVAVDVALDQAIRNLVSNAVTASFEQAVEISSARRGDMIDLAIADRGPGMPPGLLETLHHPERRGALPTEGLGIGLLLTVSSIEHCGGSLEYAPRPGGGTIAHVTIPIAKP
jgi:two-component system sensor histidine kinase RegB